MEEDMQSFYRNFSYSITEKESRNLPELIAHEKGIDNFRISPEGIYLEFKTLLYTMKQIEEDAGNKWYQRNGGKEARIFHETNPESCGK